MALPPFVEKEIQRQRYRRDNQARTSRITKIWYVILRLVFGVSIRGLMLHGAIHIYILSVIIREEVLTR